MKQLSRAYHLSLAKWQRVANSVRPLGLVGRCFLAIAILAIVLIVLALIFDVGLPAAILIATVPIIGGFTTRLFLRDGQHGRSPELRSVQRFYCNVVRRP